MRLLRIPPSFYFRRRPRPASAFDAVRHVDSADGTIGHRLGCPSVQATSAMVVPGTGDYEATAMSEHHLQRERLRDVSRLVGTLTEQMMTAFVVGTSPSDGQVTAFCRAVLLLEEHRVPLPNFAEDVIARLQVRDDAAHCPVRYPAPPAKLRRPSLVERLFQPIRKFLPA